MTMIGIVMTIVGMEFDDGGNTVCQDGSGI